MGVTLEIHCMIVVINMNNYSTVGHIIETTMYFGILFVLLTLNMISFTVSPTVPSASGLT